MLDWLKGNIEIRRTAPELYGRIVAQARRPSIYVDCGVPDTMNGRIEMILLHTLLALDRLKSEGGRGQWLGQRVMELLVADLDDALRQIGLGDDSVAKRIKRLAGALAERARDYGPALTGPWEPASAAAFEAALVDHVYRPADATAARQLAPQAARLAAYVRDIREALDALPSSELMAGRIVFSMPRKSREEGSG